MPDDAEIAYTAYAVHQHWQQVPGAALPTWANLPQDLKDAWIAAATALLAAQQPQNGG